MMATDYIQRVFRHEWLPDDMATKSLLKMAVDIFGEEEVMQKVADQLLNMVKTLPKTTVRSRSITFSRCHYTLLLGRDLSMGLTSSDAHRVVVTAEPLLRQHFPTITKKKSKKVLTTRPTLTRSVSAAFHAARRHAGRTTSTRHQLAVACTMAVMLGEREKFIRRPVSYKALYRANYLSHFASTRQLQTIIRQAVAGKQYRLPDIHIIVYRQSIMNTK